MAYPTKTFKELYYAIAHSEGRNPDADAGTVDIDDLWKGSVLACLKRAIDDTWKPTIQIEPNGRQMEFAWPESVSSLSVAPIDGVFQRSDLSSDFFSVWRSDPRSDFASGGFYKQLRMRTYEDNQGIWIQDGAELDSVFVFYRTTEPQFTFTAVDTGTTYNTVGTLVYDDTSGKVYKSIATGALGNALTDEAKWLVQNVPETLFPTLVYRTEAYRMESKDMPDRAKDKHAKADAALRIEFDRISPNLNEWPLWLWRP